MYFQTLPDFLIIGAQKAGTSSLFFYLGQHPEIVLPPEKELHFFDINYSRGINWYLKQFPEKVKESKIKTGEASPYYLYHPLAAERVASYCPESKLIVMLRNPADRAYSHFMMQKVKHTEPCATFEEAISLEPERLKGETDKMREDPLYYSFNHQKFSYLDRGLYSSQIKHWMKYFPIEQFLVIRSEDFFKYPHVELTRVYNFLGLSQVFTYDFKPVNTNSYKPMTETTRTYLNAYYEEEKKNLVSLLGNSFQWKEEHSGSLSSL